MSHWEAGTPEATPVLTPVPGMPEVWQMKTPSAQHVVLFRRETLELDLREMIGERFPLEAAAVHLRAPDSEPPATHPITPMSASSWMPDWTLGVTFPHADPFTAAYRRQVTAYTWIAIFVIGTLVVLTVVVARLLGAQMRLARLKGDLVSTVSHELRTPLASMRALVETLLADRVSDPKMEREYLELIAKENHRLSHLIENFLTFSRMERGRERFRFEPVPVRRLVEGAVEPLRNRLEAEGCEFACDVAPNLPNVKADPDAVTTVLINLLDNALKYTGEVKRIRFRVFRNDGEVCFQVEDNGVGLSADQREQIFERFFQVDQSLTRERGGCGLGLSIVRYIVRMHDGHVEVESEPGSGSTFSVSIPFLKETGEMSVVEEPSGSR